LSINYFFAVIIRIHKLNIVSISHLKDIPSISTQITHRYWIPVETPDWFCHVEAITQFAAASAAASVAHLIDSRLGQELLRQTSAPVLVYQLKPSDADGLPSILPAGQSV